MTDSAINTNIDEKYPYPGVDNDLQGFRDNFATIKDSLITAKSEINELFTNGIRKDTGSIDLNGLVIANTVIKNSAEYRYHVPEVKTSDFDIDYSNGMYQTVQIDEDLTINLINFPTDTDISDKVGIMKLHIYTFSNPRKVQFTASNAVVKYNSQFPFTDVSKLLIPGSTTTDPVILEIWQVNNSTALSTMFIKHEGYYVQQV